MIKMKAVKIVSSVLLSAAALLVAAPSSATLLALSRANCINNESISWDWPGNNHWLWTNSFHFNFKNGAWEPVIQTGWEYTWRSAAIHVGEGFQGGYYVLGRHYKILYGYGEHYFAQTQTNNCNLQYALPY